jgi:AraC-like DNA-binding protein
MPIAWPGTALSFGSPIGQMRCGPGWSLDQAWSDRLADFDLWFVWAGRGRMTLSDRTLELRPGVCLVMRPGHRYLAEQHPSDPLGVTFVHFDLRDRRTGARVADGDLPAEAHHVDVVYVHTLLSRVVTCLAPVPPRAAVPRVREQDIAARLLEALLMELELAARERPASTSRGREIANRAAALIRDAPGRSWKVAALARRAGCSPDHFARLFRDALDVSPLDFIVQTRIARARELLGESSLTIGQIADALGYSSPYFFSRQIKQHTGLTPSDLRRGRSRR